MEIQPIVDLEVGGSIPSQPTLLAPAPRLANWGSNC